MRRKIILSALNSAPPIEFHTAKSVKALITTKIWHINNIFVIYQILSTQSGKLVLSNVEVEAKAAKRNKGFSSSFFTP